MAAKKLTITDPTGTIPGLSINVRYEKMDREDAPEVEHRVGDQVVKNRAIYGDIILLEGMTRKGWVDSNGKEYQKEEIKHYYGEQEVTEKAQTSTFAIIGYQPLSAYTDSYVLAKYYEVFPDEDGKKKDFDRDIARRKNLLGMRTLWEYLHDKQVVGRAEFNVSSAGFLSTDGYCRAIQFGNKWGIDIGIFAEEKVFQHLNEGVPVPRETQSVKGPVRLKRV